MEDDRYRNRRERENPSFSSTLLDAIYRSIDEGHGRDVEENIVDYRENMRKKHNNGGFEDEKERANLRRACLIEKWMEKKVSEKVVVRRISADRDSLFLNSSSSSSDSSCGGVFSSSEAESLYGISLGYAMNIPKAIRTRASIQPEKFNKHETARKVFDKYQQHEKTCVSQQKPKHEGGGFVKTKSRALKIYGDLKKFKQPISPGSKLASFLNSIFTAGNTKKAKFSSAGDDASLERKSKSAHASTCSSASSISRSCLSKTPSSRGKVSNGMKRSVRFDSVNEIVDEPKLLAAVKTARDSVNNEEFKFHIKEKNRRVEEAARDLLRNYQKKVECQFDNIIDDDEDEVDAASYASSDLFELDNLSAIGIEMYREELPVYETTHFDTNRAIANGLIL